MKYGEIGYNEAVNFAKQEKILYGTAYKVDNNNLRNILRQEPVKGIIRKSGYYPQFHIIGKNGKPRESGNVRFDSRLYADTEIEAIEIYNELVQNRIDMLNNILNNAKGDFL